MSAAELAGQTADPAVAAVAVQDLQVVIESTGTPVISEVSFEIARGEIFGVVGESGSGKTTVGLAMLGHARRGLRIAGGSVLLGDRDILTLDEEQLRRLRGTLVSYVPQDPASSLNPALRIGTQLREVIEAHGTHRDSAVSERVAEMMREVALPDDRDLPQALPARALRRPAAAGRARDGLREPAPPHRPRRADHRPGRHDAGARAGIRSASSRRCTTSPPCT